MIDELRTEARQAALDFLTDMILFAEAQPRLSDARTRAALTQKAIDDGTHNLRITEDNITAVKAELSELRRRLAENNQANRRPTIEAEIASKDARRANLKQTKTQHQSQIDTARKMLTEARQTIVELKQVTRPKAPSGLSHLEPGAIG